MCCHIQPADPVLLLATLDRYAVALAKASPQVAFRLQMVRAALMAEGEAAMHGCTALPSMETTKVRVVWSRRTRPMGSDGKGKSTPLCSYASSSRSMDARKEQNARASKGIKGGEEGH